MKKWIYYGVMFAAVLVATACGGATPKEISTPDKRGLSIEPPEVKVISKPVPGFMRGLNLGNGLDAPSEGEWGVVLSEAHFSGAAKAGLDHVRLPVRFSTRALEQTPYTIKPEFIERVDWAVAQAKANNLSIIIDFHHYEEIMKEPAAHEERFLAIWKQLAEHYKDEPATVAFELLNEPNEKMDAAVYNPLMKKATELVRLSNPERLIFINCPFWANAEYLKDLDLSWSDDNVIASFHEYQPHVFTHQGAPWMGPAYHNTGIVFPGPPAKPIDYGDTNGMPDYVIAFFEGYNNQPAPTNPCGPFTVYQEFKWATDYVARTGKRLYMGEFGAVDKVDVESRERYLTMIRKEAERRGFGWAYWDDGGMNKGMDVQTGQWVPVIHKALFD